MDLNLDDVIAETATELSAATPEPVAPAAAPEPAAPVEPVEVAPVETAEQKAARERDEKGRFAPKGKDAPAKAPAKAADAQKPATEQPAAQAQPEAPKPTASALKPPQSWKPEAREKWGALPPEVQAEAVRLDREVRQALEQTAQARKLQEQFERTLTPYMPLLRAGGAEPVQRLAEMAQTFHTLQAGTVEQKARLVFDAIRANNIPLEAINAYFDNPNAQPAAPQQAAPVPEEIEQRVMQRLAQQQATQQWQAFAAQNEFAEDVRPLMASVIEGRARAGQPVKDFAEAYALACQMHPAVSAALAQRKEAEAAAQQTQQAQQARSAAVSVRSQPAGVVPPRKLESIEDYVAAAADELRAGR